MNALKMWVGNLLRTQSLYIDYLFLCLLISFLCLFVVWFGLVWFSYFGLFVCLFVCLFDCLVACLVWSDMDMAMSLTLTH